MSDDSRRDPRALGGDSTGGALPLDPTLTGVRRQRLVRTTTVGLVAVGATAALVLGALALADRRQDPPVVAGAASSPATTSAPDPRPTLTPSPTPVSTSTPVATPESPRGPGFTLGADGSIADFPPDAPEAEVVAYLDGKLGLHSVSDPAMACWIDNAPGRLLSWGDTLFVLIRTEVMTSPGDPGPPLYAPAPAYVAGWNLTDDTFGLRTAEGLGVGDTVTTLRATYPDVPGELSWVPPLWVWAQGTLQVLTEGGDAGDRVNQIAAGYICPLD